MEKRKFSIRSIFFTLVTALVTLNSALAAQREALMVIGTVSIPDLNASDAAIKARLEALDFLVTVVQAPVSTASDANGKALILISSTVASADVATKFRTVPVPAIMWEQAVQDDFAMTGDTAADRGSAAGFTDLEIVNSSHPLAAGLSGVVPIAAAADTFSWGLPVDSAIKIAQIPADPTKFPIYAYDTNAVMFGGFVAPARRVMLPMGDATYAMMTAEGLSLVDAAINWAAIPLSELPTATISITSPAEGATFAGGANVNFTVNAADPGGPIKRVEFFSGDLKIGESTTSPFSFTWTNAPPGRHVLTARAVDQRDRVVISRAVNITVGSPPPEALLVVGTVSNPNLNPSDAAIQARLHALGILVQIRQDTASIATDANGKILVIISSTVTSGNVAAKFRDVTVPVINWEQAVQDDLMMTLNTDTVDRGTLTGQTALEILDPFHPLAAGLSGTVTIVTNADTFSWGNPSAAATANLVAQVPGDPSKYPLYAYEAGATMIDGVFVAPARRLMLPMGDATYVNLTPEGRAIFDAAIRWAANITNDLPPLQSTATIAITSPTEGATFAASNNIAVTVNASDPRGPVLRVEFFADNIKIGESTTSPFNFTWTNVVAGRYTLVAEATDRIGLKVRSAPVNIIVGTPPPEVLMVVGTVSNPNLNPSDTAVRARIEAAGYVVVVVQDSVSTTDDANGKVLVIISSTVTSGNVAAKFRDIALPVIEWEQAIQDDFNMTGPTEGVDRGTIAGQTALEILDPAHPLAAGLSGTVTIVNVAEPFTWGLPTDSAIKVAQVVGDPTKFPIYAYDTGALMFNGFPAPARRILLPMGDATFANMTEDGLKLFDAAFAWAVSTDNRPRFNAPIRQANNMNISWTGAGTLQQADSLSGPWTDAPNQANPQAIPTTAPIRFYRIRQ